MAASRLAPFYGVPSLSYFSRRNGFESHHLDLANRVFDRVLPGGFLALDRRAAHLVEPAIGKWGRESFVEDSPTRTRVSTNDSRPHYQGNPVTLIKRLRRVAKEATGDGDVRIEEQLKEILHRLTRLEEAIADLKPNIKMLPAIVRKLYLDGVELPCTMCCRSVSASGRRTKRTDCCSRCSSGSARPTGAASRLDAAAMAAIPDSWCRNADGPA